jgi:hypothetical protein
MLDHPYVIRETLCSQVLEVMNLPSHSLISYMRDELGWSLTFHFVSSLYFSLYCPCVPPTPCSFGLSVISKQYFSLRTNQPPATSQQYFSLTTNQHQPSATSQTNRLSSSGCSVNCSRHALPWRYKYKLSLVISPLIRDYEEKFAIIELQTMGFVIIGLQTWTLLKRPLECCAFVIIGFLSF